MSILANDPSSVIQDFVLLYPSDFPLNFQDGVHPGDYMESDAPIEPECIYHHVRGKHKRLWFRVSWRLKSGKFVPISFLLDTGAPKHLYLTQQVLKILEDDGTATVNEDMCAQCVKLYGRNCIVEESPTQHQANVMGLNLLKRFKLQLFDEEPHFSLNLPAPFFMSDKPEEP
jgi:hypothetical protein